MKLKNYWKPTPKKWRQFGDALLAMSMYAETQQALEEHTSLLTAIVIVGLIGKFLTNFFSE